MLQQFSLAFVLLATDTALHKHIETKDIKQHVSHGFQRSSCFSSLAFRVVTDP
jgi:hypothetical protein